jgi:hypothetical protein
VGAELGVAAGCEAARLAAINAVVSARQHLGSLDRVKRVVRLGVSVATEGNVSNLRTPDLKEFAVPPTDRPA